MSERDLCEGCDRQTDPINLFHCQILGHNITKDKCLAIRKGKKEKIKIGELKIENVYRRAGGELFKKLNERFHVKVKLSNDKKSWLGDGCAEELNFDEVVDIIQ